MTAIYESIEEYLGALAAKGRRDAQWRSTGPGSSASPTGAPARGRLRQRAYPLKPRLPPVTETLPPYSCCPTGRGGGENLGVHPQAPARGDTPLDSPGLLGGRWSRG